MASFTGERACSSSHRPRYTHDVFLNFRGRDTRNNFTAHLYKALRQKGIRAYRDDVELQRGKNIHTTLWKAIEESRFSIVVFSKDYASSPWCLDELVQIVQYMKEGTCTVLPVFYDVDPSEVADIVGGYERAFLEHQNTFKKTPQRVQIWRDNLIQVAKELRWDVRNRNEADVIDEIVEHVFRKLRQTFISVEKKLIGMDSHTRAMDSLLDMQSNDVRFIGIWGMGGIGKTTIARAIFSKIGPEFDNCCFLASIREGSEKRGLHYLQEQLLSQILSTQSIRVWDVESGVVQMENRFRYKKVLIVLDDVDDKKHLESLAGKHDWYGPGSRIIITSRDKHLLTVHQVDGIYEVKKLKSEEALTLFSWKAFKQDHPLEEYSKLSKRVVEYVDGLPLAIEVLGAFLYKRSIVEWESAISRLDDVADTEEKIVRVLRVSFDGLEDLQKNIFLDIACFFNGMDMKQVSRMLDSFGFYAAIGLQVLKERCLVSVYARSEMPTLARHSYGPKSFPAMELEENMELLRMHDLLQVMGKQIVYEESPDDPGKRSRLWAPKDILHLLMHKEETHKVQGIFLNLPEIDEAQWNIELFPRMCRLRLFSLYNVYMPKGPAYLSEELRFLEWSHYPSNSLPPDFELLNLLALHMRFSCIEQLWRGVKSSSTLRIIDLSYSENLAKTPDFRGTPNLKKLILIECTRLFEVHESIDCLQTLEYLNLEGCCSLKTLPSCGGMESLRVLILKGCKNLISLPNSVSGLKSLKTLELSGCSSLPDLPESLGEIEFLEKLDISGTAIRHPPECIFLLKNLKELSLRGCKGEQPKNRQSILNYVTKKMDFWDWVFPESRIVDPQVSKLSSLSSLYCLEELDLSDCKLGEGAIPDDFNRLFSLKELNLRNGDFVSLPHSISLLSKLVSLSLENCKMLKSTPILPLSIKHLSVSGCTSLEEMPGMLNLCNGEYNFLYLCNCFNLHKDSWDDMALNMVQSYLPSKERSVQTQVKRIDFVIPGSRIPKWFSHQSQGSAISLPMSELQRLCDDNRWEGIAAFASFKSIDQASNPWPCSDTSPPGFRIYFKRSGRIIPQGSVYSFMDRVQVLSDHIWLIYLSRSLLGFKRPSGEYAFDELAFEPCSPGIEIVSCGFRLVTMRNMMDSTEIISTTD